MDAVHIRTIGIVDSVHTIANGVRNLLGITLGGLITQGKKVGPVADLGWKVEER